MRPVSALNQGAELGTNFVLTSARHFVVEHFNRNAQGFENQGHFSAQVLRAVHWRHGEIAALGCRTVTAVAAFQNLAAVPGCFVFVDFEADFAGFVGPTHAVEDEEFRFRTEESGIAQARRLQVGFSALGNRTRIAVVRLAVAWLHHVTLQEQRGFFEKRVDVGGIRVGHELHVRSFNALPAGNGRTIESVAGSELVFVECRDWHGHVLLFTTGIGETKVDKLDFVFFHHLHHVGDGLGHQILLLHSYKKVRLRFNAAFVPSSGTTSEKRRRAILP